VFDWGLQSSLEKLILELNASDVDEQRVRYAGFRFRINYLLELPTKVRLNNPERPAVVMRFISKFLTVGRGTASQQANQEISNRMRKVARTYVVWSYIHF